VSKRKRRRASRRRSGSVGGPSAPASPEDASEVPYAEATPSSARASRGSASRSGRAGPLRGQPSPARPSPESTASTTSKRPREPDREAVVHPPIPLSLARGLAAVGASPALLVSSFLGVLVFWLAFSAYVGVLAAVPPALMVLFESLPPLHSLAVDIQFLAAGRTTSAAVPVAFAAGLLVVRAALSSFWISLILDALEPRPIRRNSLREAAARAARSLPAMIGIELGFIALIVLSLMIAGTFLGASFGQIGVILALVGGTYFFVFAPVIAVAERRSARASIPLALRTARLPGPRHLVFTVGYIALSLFVSQAVPGSRGAQATPSFQVWVYALFVNFLHVSVLAALVYRWLAVRDYVLSQEGEGRRSPGTMRPQKARRA